MSDLQKLLSDWRADVEDQMRRYMNVHLSRAKSERLLGLLAVVEAVFALTQVSDYEGERRPDIAFKREFNRICTALAALTEDRPNDRE